MSNKYGVNPEGIAGLRALSGSLKVYLAQILSASLELQGSCEENRSGLGPHAGKIIEILKSVSQIAKQVQPEVESLSSRISEIAEAYQEIIDMDYFGDGDDSGEGHGEPVKVLSRRR